MSNFTIFDPSDIIEFTVDVEAYGWYSILAISGSEERNQVRNIPAGRRAFVDGVSAAFLRFIVLRKGDDNYVDSKYSTMVICNQELLNNIRIIRKGKMPDPAKPRNPSNNRRRNTAVFGWPKSDFPNIPAEEYSALARVIQSN